MNKKFDTLDETLFLATDAVKDQTKDQATKMLADLFKSAILKKYKDAFDEELFVWPSVSAQRCKMTKRMI